MKAIIVILSFLLLASCSNSYCEYEVVNHSSKSVVVEISTYEGDYSKYLSYTILPNERKNVFEHPCNLDKTRETGSFRNYIKDIKIYTEISKEKVIKAFTINNMKVDSQNGLFGNFKVYEFEINDSDIE